MVFYVVWVGKLHCLDQMLRNDGLEVDRFV